MCGICCYISNIQNQLAFDNVYIGLEALQNRGYDSAGICSIKNGKFICKKKASDNNQTAIQFLKKQSNDFKECNIMIGHTRWATHGPKTDVNSHPHFDNTNTFGIVHNGIIENYSELKSSLKEKGIKFYSQTDTEVIANLIYENYKNLINLDNRVELAIRKTLQQLEGTWGLVIMCVDEPNRLYCARHGSPLLIGTSDDYIMISSEQSGFSKFINKCVYLKDGDMVILESKHNGVIFHKIHDYEFKKIKVNNDITTPAPFNHWTLKEITEQPESALRAMGMGGRISNSEISLGGLQSHKQELLKLNNLVLLGCGTSYHSGLWAQSLFKEITNFNSIQVIDGGEFSQYDISKGNTGLILISQSGETKDLHSCIEIAKKNDLFLMGVVNVVDSLIAREVDCGVYLNAGREVAVASTKAFTSQAIVLSLISLWFSQLHSKADNTRIRIINSLTYLSDDIKTTIELVGKSSIQTAEYLLNKSSLFILGKGLNYSIAKEGALKIKEIGYIHAEGFSSSALKHGPYSLIEAGTPVILITPNDSAFNRNQGVAEELISRGAYLIGISDIELDDKYEIKIRVAKNNYFTSLLSIIPLQLIAYNLAVLKGHNPDMPRNLAKTVTVF